MDTYTVAVTSVRQITHDVLGIRTEKPDSFRFTSGQATELAICKNGWQEIKRPFTFTCIPSDDYLEFMIKIYPAHKGVTQELSKIKVNEQLLIGDAWGAISYGGPGLFIAGGAGITPFISIFRQLATENRLAGNRLLFANKTRADIILEAELNHLLQTNIVHVLSEETSPEYKTGFITADLISENIPPGSRKVYVCGPPPMMDAVLAYCRQLGIADTAITVEI